MAIKPRDKQIISALTAEELARLDAFATAAETSRANAIRVGTMALVEKWEKAEIRAARRPR